MRGDPPTGILSQTLSDAPKIGSAKYPFPDAVAAGIRVARIGSSSIGRFRNDDQEIAAAGHFVHVYVDRQSGEPVPVPAATREVLAALQV